MKNITRLPRSYRVASIVLAICLPVRVHAELPRYVVTEIPTFGGLSSTARAINASGQVTGEAQVKRSTVAYSHAFLYSDGVMKDLGPLSDHHSMGFAINNKGQVVGRYNLLGEPVQAFFHDGSTMINLGPILGNSEAYGINDIGQIVGRTWISGSVRAFLYQNGIASELPFPEADQGSIARAINNKGQITGQMRNRAFLYSNGIITDLSKTPPLNYPYTISSTGGYGINDEGKITGRIAIYKTINGSSSVIEHLLLYSDGVVTDLTRSYLNSDSFRGYAINNKGQIVGTRDASTFLYSDGTLTSLSNLLGIDGRPLATTGWSFPSTVGAYGINDAGQIVGTGVFNGKTRGYILTPESVAVPPQINLSTTALSLTEGGASGTYTVALTHVPRGDVTVTIAPDNQLSASPTTLTFTNANWNIPQTISVSAIQDGIAEGKHTGIITHTVSSGDTRYNGIAVNKLSATITDAAAPTVKLPFASGTIWTQPDLSLSGTAAPGVTVTLTLTNLSTGEVRAVSAVADANGNWNVTLTGLTDGSYELQPEADGVTGTKIGFAIDSHAPVSTLSVTAGTGPNAAGWYTVPVNIALTATDGTGGQGVARGEYTLDGSAWTAFPNTGLTVSTDGSHNVCYRSVDKAGNIEAARCVTIAIDTTAPQVNPVFDAAASTLNLNAQDTVSGISTIETSIDGGATWNTQTGPVAFTRDGNYAVQYRVRDKAGNLASGQTSVTVATIPTITAPANQIASEGTSQTFNLGSFTDLAGDSPWNVDVDWGDGSAHTAFTLTTVGSLGNQSHLYADNGTYTVTVKVTDQAGNADSKTFQIAATNAAPTATLAAGGPVNEGGSTTLTLNNASDASNADTLAGFRYAFACDGASLTGAIYATASANATASCTFSDSGNRTVRARILDKDDGFTEYTAVVTVNNVAPTAILNVSGAVNEGSAATIAFGNQSDVSPADVLAGFRYAFACNGASLASATYANSSASATSTCSYADGPGTYPVRARIIDKDDGFTEYTAVVTVNNAAPSVSGVTAPVDPVLVNTAVTVSAAFTDAGVLDTHTAIIDWGDGSNSAGSVSEANGSGSVTGSHAYSTAGTYTITVAVTDKDGGINNASYQSVVVIDPAGASINGNGRMTSPSGAMPGNPGATGQARLKVKADYKGAGALTGDLSFEFKGGNLDFQSTSYDWLAAFGSKATLKGSGTVNGSGNYGFIVSSGEGNPDVVRVKIWNPATGQVVYDSQPGANDFADPVTQVDNGNIAVH